MIHMGWSLGKMKIRPGMSTVFLKTIKFYNGLAPRHLMGHRFMSIEMSKRKKLDLDCLNPSLKKIEYAVRGPIVEIATKLQDELNRV